jgi:hypothetical protein
MTVHEGTPLLHLGISNGNGTATDVLHDDAQPPLPIIDLRHHEKTVSLLLEDEEDHVFRLVEPGDIDNFDDAHQNHTTNSGQHASSSSPPHHRARSESHGSMMDYRRSQGNHCGSDARGLEHTDQTS